MSTDAIPTLPIYDQCNAHYDPVMIDGKCYCSNPQYSGKTRCAPGPINTAPMYQSYWDSQFNYSGFNQSQPQYAINPVARYHG